MTKNPRQAMAMLRNMIDSEGSSPPRLSHGHIANEEPFLWRCSVTWGPLNRTNNVMSCRHVVTCLSRLVTMACTASKTCHSTCIPRLNCTCIFPFSFFTLKCYCHSTTDRNLTFAARILKKKKITWLFFGSRVNFYNCMIISQKSWHFREYFEKWTQVTKYLIDLGNRTLCSKA